jgi:hypothetical protein
MFLQRRRALKRLCSARMIRSTSSLAQLSPLVARTPRPVSDDAEAPPALPQDEVELSSSPPPKSSRWLKLGLAAGLGVVAAASLVGPAQVALQQVLPGSAAPSLSLVEQLRYQGYAGESAVQRQQVTQTMYDHLELFDSPTGRQDGKIGVSDLQRVAASQEVPAVARDSAQAVLADPVLMNSLDVAHGRRVDNLISDEDLQQALSYEQGGYLGSFVDVQRQLQTPIDGQTPFEFYAGGDDKFSWDDVYSAASSENAPEPFRVLARDLVANPTYMNGLDVASSTHDTGLVSLLQRSHYRDGVVSAQDLQNIAYSPLPETGLQFTLADQIALDQVLAGRAELSEDVFRNFYQTDRGNCASTAVIKAAMERFGSDIFSDVQKLDSGSYRITMQDGFQLDVSPGELEAAATAAHFHGDQPEAKSLATLSYASMAKRAWMMGHEGAQTYGHALLSLNNGEITPHVPTYLGLKERVHKVRRDEVQFTEGAVVYGNGHAYYVDKAQDGQLLGDKWGTALPWEGKTFVNEGELQDGAFVLR